MTTYCKLNDPAVATLLNKTFPGLRLQQCAVSVHDAGGLPLSSYWSGGTKDDHRIVRLSDMQVFSVPENGSGFTAVDRTFGPAGLPVDMPAPGFAVVTYTHGSYNAVSIHVHSADATKMIAPPVETTWAEKVVLVATRSMKSSYGGKDRYTRANEDLGTRWDEVVITRAQWNEATVSLKARGFLNAAGAITIDGRNAAGSGDLYRLRPVTAEVTA